MLYALCFIYLYVSYLLLSHFPFSLSPFFLSSFSSFPASIQLHPTPPPPHPLYDWRPSSPSSITVISRQSPTLSDTLAVPRDSLHRARNSFHDCPIKLGFLIDAQFSVSHKIRYLFCAKMMIFGRFLFVFSCLRLRFYRQFLKKTFRIQN